MSAYVDLDDLKATISLSGTTFANSDCEEAIVTASDGLDFILDRSFGLTEDQAGETRYFSCEDSQLASIDDLTTLVSIAVDRDGDGVYEEAWAEGTQFRFEPLNAPAHGEPYTHIRTLSGYQLPTGRLSTVKIVALFGWPSPPQGIVTATKIIASKMLIRKKSAPLGIVMGAEFAVRIARYDPDVQFAIAPYNRRPSIASLRLG